MNLRRSCKSEKFNPGVIFYIAQLHVSAIEETEFD
jgi:hypothetical protein